MATFYVARHGQNVDNANGILNGHRDLPLTELGEKQAQTLGQQVLYSGAASIGSDRSVFFQL
jgi:broad specificity phosphatase PhoE